MEKLILVLLALCDNSFLNEPNKCVIKKLHKALLFIQEPVLSCTCPSSEKDAPSQRKDLKIDRLKIKRGEGWDEREKGRHPDGGWGR